ncbi:hypothetical protein FH972_011603 [Carpinus fangiana]|uniref:Uncharacterized protein n=1 Tax=Carpinus fangiana TaxID=176857 RepID=A0A660KUX6_9ROSI|nr:hypothetical protein FH972_011603 [Carpinus fangiana]
MLQLGTILHSNGFSITVVHTQYNSPDPSTHPDFSFLPLPDTSSALTGEFIPFALQLNINCENRFKECLAEVMRQQGQDNGIACIIYDEIMYFSQAAAKDLKLLSIVLRTGCAAISLTRDVLFQLGAEGHIPFSESRSNDLVPELYPLRFKDLPIMEKLENFLQLLSKASNIGTSSAIIYNTIDCLENSSLAKCLRARERDRKARQETSTSSAGASTNAVPRPHTSSAVTNGEFIAFSLQLNTNCKARFQECMAEVMRQQGLDDGIACIIYDDLMYFSEAAAKDLKLPSIILRTGCAANFLARIALTQLKQQGHIPFPEFLSSQDPELYSLRFKDLPILENLENFLQLVLLPSFIILWTVLKFIIGKNPEAMLDSNLSNRSNA